MSARRDERGAVALLTAVLAVVLLGAAAFTVDLGMQRVVRTDMQSTVDTAALDMTRALVAGTAPGTPAWTHALAESIAGDPSTLGHAEAMPAGWASADAVCTPKLCAEAIAGYLDADARFTATAPAGATAYSAVEVTATAAVSRGLSSVLGSGDLAATRSAVATSTLPDTCYRVGSYALGVDTAHSLLGPLLGLAGADQAVTILSSDGVATADVSLLALATQLGVATPSELVSLPGLTIGRFLLASATVLDARGDTARADALRSLQVAMGAAAGRPMSLASLLALGQGDASALDADVSVGDLVSGALLVADGSAAIDLPGLRVSVPGLGTLTASAQVVRPPVLGCNGAAATAAQVHIVLHADAISIPLVASVKNFAITVSLANASAVSSTVTSTVAGCSTSSMTLQVTDQTLADVRLTADVYALLGLVKVAQIDTGGPRTVQDGTYQLPVPGSYTVPVLTGTGTVGLHLSGADVSLLGVLNVGPLLAGLSPLLDAVTGTLTGTVLPALGVTTAGADLYAVPPTPTCGSPRLVG